MERKLRKYANFLLTRCLSIKAKEPLLINYHVEEKDFANIVKEEAFNLGIKDVYEELVDNEKIRDIMLNSTVEEIKNNPLLKGVTFSGGEPFLQAEAFTELAQRCHELGLDVICYTGYTFEKLVSSFAEHPEWETLLKNIDTLIDGPFVEEKKSLMLLFRGSSNQRMLDMVRSLKQMCPVAVEA